MNEHDGSSAVTTNQIVLEKAAGSSYQEVRHVVLRGTNHEIGRAIAQISRDSYQATPLPFGSRTGKEARLSYIQKHHPVLAERIQGVEDLYGRGDDNLYDPSSLWYDIQPVNCSSVFFPGADTANGHSLQARVMDFYTVDIIEFMTGQPGKGNKLFSRNFVMETYPEDGGYASLVVGTFDLLNGAYDGFNEHGLCISGLVDQNLAQKTVSLAELEQQEGLSYLQMVRAVLEGASTVAEAKELVGGLKVYFPMDGIHFLLSDRTGDSTILEFSEEDLTPRFIEPASPGPVIMTNHAVAKYPSTETFPPIDKAREYDTFYRYIRLRDYLAAHGAGGFTTDDAFEALSLVYGFVDDSSEGTALPLPLRAIWSLVMDLDDLSLKIRFYATDDEAARKPLFTDDFSFSLRK